MKQIQRMRAIATVVLALCISLISCRHDNSSPSEPTELTGEALVLRGKYLVTVSACHDCHSPKVMTYEGPMPDTSRLLSGHPKDAPIPEVPKGAENWVLFEGSNFTSFVGPWGVSFAANLTPDKTGTGEWTFEQFKTAIRRGKYKGLEGSRSLLPPMPWQMYRTMNDDDLRAIFAYLRSIKPVDNLVPAPISLEDLAKR